MDTTADSGTKVAEARAKMEREIWKNRRSKVIFGLLVLGPIMMGAGRLLLGFWPDFPSIVAVEGLALFIVLTSFVTDRKEYEQELGRRRAAGLEE